jgi:hypothetical protein
MALNTHDRWDMRCRFLEEEMARTPYGYAMTPYPTVGGLDLAGLFMYRRKFVETGLYFSKCVLWLVSLFCFWCYTVDGSGWAILR